MLMYKLYGQDN